MYIVEICVDFGDLRRWTHRRSHERVTVTQKG